MINKLNIIILLTLIQLSSSCGQQKNLSEQDVKIVQELGFDLELMKQVRGLTSGKFEIKNPSEYGIDNFRDSANYFNFELKGIKGILIKESQENATLLISRLKDELNHKGYFIYLSETNYGYSPDEVTILKTDDKYDLLRFEGTNGLNYGILVEDVIDKLKEWDNKYQLEFTGVGFDFFQANYSRLPENTRSHAKELYDFCPDIVDQGTGSVKELEKEIIASKELFLWWD